MSDQSLRDALEKLAEQYEGDAKVDDGLSYHRVSAQLRRLLAAHPVEPAPVVTDEAVDAAVDVLMDYGHNGLQCDPTPCFSTPVRRALEAAAPLLGSARLPTSEQIAEVLDPTAFGVLRNDASYDSRRKLALSDADAVLALLNGTEA